MWLIVVKVFASNKKAYFLYSIVDTIEVGVALSGNEVKSIRQGHVSLNGSYAVISVGTLSLLNCHITAYKNAHGFSRGKEDRSRVLLAHKKQINKLKGDISAKRLTLVPLKMYDNGKGCIKILLGVAKHKNVANRKNELKERDLDREARRELKDR